MVAQRYASNPQRPTWCSQRVSRSWPNKRAPYSSGCASELLMRHSLAVGPPGCIAVVTDHRLLQLRQPRPSIRGRSRRLPLQVGNARLVIEQRRLRRAASRAAAVARRRCAAACATLAELAVPTVTRSHLHRVLDPVQYPTLDDLLIATCPRCGGHRTSVPRLTWGDSRTPLPILGWGRPRAPLPAVAGSCAWAFLPTVGRCEPWASVACSGHGAPIQTFSRACSRSRASYYAVVRDSSVLTLPHPAQTTQATWRAAVALSALRLLDAWPGADGDGGLRFLR